jgi:hypothetical protein
MIRGGRAWSKRQYSTRHMAAATADRSHFDNNLRFSRNRHGRNGAFRPNPILTHASTCAILPSVLRTSEQAKHPPHDRLWPSSLIGTDEVSGTGRDSTFDIDDDLCYSIAASVDVLSSLNATY